MPLDPSRLRPIELLQLLNNTPLGLVLTEPGLRRQRTIAGARFSADGRKIHLLHYVAWLVVDRHQRQAEAAGLTGYEAQRERARQRQADLARSGRDIGELPAVVDQPRRDACARDFRRFCEVYFPQMFYLPWSPDHLKVVARIEQAVLTGGLFALAMPRGSGKALALDTPLPTPNGWTTMGAVQVDDELFDEQGRPCRVKFATEVQVGRSCYEVHFSDGERIVCDGDHLWTVFDRHSRRNPLTLPTKAMIDRVQLPDSRQRRSHRYRIRLAAPLETQPCRLPIAPYALGVWLGDGTCSSATVTLNGDDADEIAANVAALGEYVAWRQSHTDANCRTAIFTRCAARVLSFHGRLRWLGLLGNKHIPTAYLRASRAQRLELLQGLMDTDGSVDQCGHCEITVKCGPLADTLCELLSTLGIKYGRSERWVTLEGRRHGPYARINFVVHDGFSVFRLTRKRNRLKPIPATRPLSISRHIVAINPTASVPVRCIQVDSPSSLYLAGRRMVPTHNTSMCESATLWALLYGHRPFVAIVGPDETHAADRVASLRTELENNDTLLADFPEVCFPLRRLEGITQRRLLYHGQPVRMELTAKQLVLPEIPDSVAAGGVVSAAGITGQIRGLNYKRSDGTVLRPSFVLIDDPQTDESANSPSQCAARERIVNGAILGLAGPGQTIAAIMPCTVVRPDDLADRLLDRDRNPQWQGERTKMIYAWPTNEALWAKYVTLRQTAQREVPAEQVAQRCNAFYAAHREEMDAGAIVAWPARHNANELSAIQHAWNLRIDRKDPAFFAEYQNEPLPDVQADDDLLTVEQIMAKVNGHQRGEIPLACTHLTMFVDIQQKALFYVIVAWEDDFTGYVVDYGTEPDQKSTYFTLRDIRRTLAAAAPRAGLEGSIYAGLERLTAATLGREWRRDDGAHVRIDRCLIDANWGSSTDVVYQFCRQSQFAGVVLPSHGRGIGPSHIPLGEYRRKRGDRVGLNWRIPVITGRRAVRHVVFDTNFWKSFVHARLAVPMGDPGCLSLFGQRAAAGRAAAAQHRLFGEHVTSEYRVKTEGRGRTVDVWQPRADGLDNHWLDGLVGAAVAASMQGAMLFGTAGRRRLRERIRLSELQGARR